MESLRAWLWLRSIHGLGATTVTRLVLQFGSPEAVQSASLIELTAREGVSPSIARAIRQSPDHQFLRESNREIEQWKKGTYTILTIIDPSYPARLKMISDPPPLLYVTGQLQPVDQLAVAIVGSRHGTPAGCAMTRQLSGNLAALGFTIVSGLARGIDAAAHQGALAVKGRTVAVLGCGIDRTYPPEHHSLRQDIEGHGAILSEFSPGTPVRGRHFPQRNRLISGLCLGVVVTEAALRSGSLITARLALEQNREVFAVPGALSNTMSQGPHSLIKQGATLVERAEDIVAELRPQLGDIVGSESHPGPPQPVETNDQIGSEEKSVYDLISLEPVSLEELIAQDCFSPAELMSILLSLEMKGLIQQLPGSRYIKQPSP